MTGSLEKASSLPGKLAGAEQEEPPLPWRQEVFLRITTFFPYTLRGMALTPWRTGTLVSGTLFCEASLPLPRTAELGGLNN